MPATPPLVSSTFERDTARTMSEANVELVRSSVEALRRRGADASLEFMAENVEVHPDSSRFPEASTALAVGMGRFCSSLG
jgi:hypothetical protein